MSWRTTLLGGLMVAVAVWGCSSGTESTGAGGGTGGASEGGAGGGGGEPGVPSLDPCRRVATGPGSPASEEVLAWSAVHAWIRFFGTSSHAEVDGALAAALEVEPFTASSLQRYADGLPTIACTASANPTASLGPAAVSLEGGLAVVTPGTGAIAIPAEATAVAIDLRDLPAVSELATALGDASRAAFASPVPRIVTAVRRHDGMTDEVFDSDNVYANLIEEVVREDWPGEAAVVRPVALLTDAELAPEAVRFALDARDAERAVIVGENLLTFVGESQWHPVGPDQGLLVRDRQLGSPQMLPNVVDADRRAAEPIAAAAALLQEGGGFLPIAGGVTRIPLAAFPKPITPQPDEQSAGAGRAALITAHGAARLFFPYFDTVGDTLDLGLEEGLAIVDASPSPSLLTVIFALARLGAELFDSHVYVGYFGLKVIPRKLAPVLLDVTAANEVVVRKSLAAGVSPGDRLEAVDGLPIQDAIAAHLPIPGATASARMRAVLIELTVLDGDRTWTLRKPDDSVVQASLELANLPGVPADLFSISARTAGPLDDLGHPDIYYVNLDGPAYDGTPTPAQIVAAAQPSKALVLDGRGYPDTTATWSLIRHLLPAATYVRFNYPIRSPFIHEAEPDEQLWGQELPTYTGPVYVLVGPSTLSQAEHILMPLVSTDRAVFVGRETAGSNGNITGVMLPGAMAFSFTGMEVLFDDGSTFHGIGIPPTVEVHPTVAALAAGLDDELQAAVDLIAAL